MQFSIHKEAFILKKCWLIKSFSLLFQIKHTAHHKTSDLIPAPWGVVRTTVITRVLASPLGGSWNHGPEGWNLKPIALYQWILIWTPLKRPSSDVNFLVAWLKVMRSISIMLSTTSVCSFDIQMNGHPLYIMTNPLLEGSSQLALF